jgi:hypothetical protein
MAKFAADGPISRRRGLAFHDFLPARRVQQRGAIAPMTHPSDRLTFISLPILLD